MAIRNWGSFTLNYFCCFNNKVFKVAPIHYYTFENIHFILCSSHFLRDLILMETSISSSFQNISLVVKILEVFNICSNDNLWVDFYGQPLLRPSIRGNPLTGFPFFSLSHNYISNSSIYLSIITPKEIKLQHFIKALRPFFEHRQCYI